MKPPSKETFETIARVYDLVGELNEAVVRLRGVGVTVYLGSTGSLRDPLGLSSTVVRIEMGCQAQPEHG